MRLLKFIIPIFFIQLHCHSQALMDRAGKVVFFSDAIVEDIAATNSQALAAMDPVKGTVAVSMLMRGFKFEKSLMEEHFNENYVESEKFPKATFKGNLEKPVDDILSKPGTYSFNVTGDLTIHGVTKPLSTNITMVVGEKDIKVSSKFNVRVADHDIKVPTIVIENIAEVVEVTSDFTFIKPAK